MYAGVVAEQRLPVTHHSQGHIAAVRHDGAWSRRPVTLEGRQFFGDLYPRRQTCTTRIALD